MPKILLVFDSKRETQKRWLYLWRKAMADSCSFGFKVERSLTAARQVIYPEIFAFTDGFCAVLAVFSLRTVREQFGTNVFLGEHY